MKNSIKLLAFVVLGALATASCTYENGPKLTLLSKKARLCRQWKATKYEDSNGNSTNATDDGSYVEYKKDGSVTLHDGGSNSDANGTWEWADGKKDVKITFSAGGFSYSSTAEILRLTTKELQTKDGNGNITYMDAK